MLSFYAIEHGYQDGWEVHYVLATSAQDAADRYIRRRKAMYKDSEYTIEAEVYETTFDEYGILQRQWDMENDPKILGANTGLVMDMLKDFLDWDRILKAKRYSGGHEDVMSSLFINGIVLASVTTGDYQGTVAYAYLVYGYTHTAKIVLMSDSYGSCSGCDAWEDASDTDIRQLCTNLANDAHTFDNIEEAITWLEAVTKKDAFYYEWDGLGLQLAAELTKKLEEIKQKGL